MSPLDEDPPAEGPEEGEPASRGPLARLRAVWANPAYRFVILFLPFLGGVSVAYTQLVKHSSPVIQWFIKATAFLEYLLLDLFSSEVEIKGKMIWFGDFAVKIIDECTGIYEMLIFAAAVLAFPTSWRDKGLGILMGCPLIYVFNVIRIAMLIVVGRYWPNAFEFMHIYFWQATMIVMITTVWLLWITKVVKHDETPISHST